MAKALIYVPNEIYKRLKMLAAIEEIPVKDEIINQLGLAVLIDDPNSWRSMLMDIEKVKKENE